MGTSLDKLTIKGFKSIRELIDLELTNLNVVVGGTGAGDLLFNGRKITPDISIAREIGIPAAWLKSLERI